MFQTFICSFNLINCNSKSWLPLTPESLKDAFVHGGTSSVSSARSGSVAIGVLAAPPPEIELRRDVAIALGPLCVSHANVTTNEIQSLIESIYWQLYKDSWFDLIPFNYN